MTGTKAFFAQAIALQQKSSEQGIHRWLSLNPLTIEEEDEDVERKVRSCTANLVK